MIPERIEAVSADIGDGMRVRRSLPTRHRRLVGAWCFLDHFGPFRVAPGDDPRAGRWAGFAKTECGLHP